MSHIDRRKQESCERYEPPELAPLGELGKLTFGGGRDAADFGHVYFGTIIARSALDDVDLGPSRSAEPDKPSAHRDPE